MVYTICPADNATAGSLGRRRAGQLRFGFVAVSAGHIVCHWNFGNCAIPQYGPPNMDPQYGPPIWTPILALNIRYSKNDNCAQKWL
jgi:hypothetical protein